MPGSQAGLSSAFLLGFGGSWLKGWVGLKIKGLGSAPVMGLALLELRAGQDCFALWASLQFVATCCPECF